MKDEIKIAFIGAGSKTFASCVINDIVSSPDLADVKVKVWLVDINADSLKRMHAYAERAATFRKSKVVFAATTDRLQALPGADFVIVPDQAPPLPEGFAAMLRVQHSVHKLMIMAYQEKSRPLLLQALLTDPVTDSALRAEKFMDYMLELQAPYLPEMK